MAEFPRKNFEELPYEAKRRIDAVCTRFESAWKDTRPVIEDYLVAVQTDERPILFQELLLIEFECRRRAGENPRIEDYLDRFTDLEQVIRTMFPSANDTRELVNAVGQPSIPIRPAQVPGYQLLDEIGRGGMAVVYKARHLALNRLVALKFILTGREQAPRHLERFRREAEMIARLRHPNIVQVYDIGEVEGQYFIALEYAEGGSLRQFLNGAPVEPRTAALLLEPLARAIQHAHRLGIVHRDLKPANVLLVVGGDSVALQNRVLPNQGVGRKEIPSFSGAGPPLEVFTPKLTDFGLARCLDLGETLTEQGNAAGTPQYMAPEQACADPLAGPLVDIWAMGATLYELLTGRPPFRAATPRETLQLIVDADPVPPSQLQPSVPRDLETICLRCLEKDPARRYPGARELAQDLRRYLDGESIHARPRGKTERIHRWARRRPLLATLTVLGFVVCVGLLLTLSGALLHALGERRRAANAERESLARAGQAETLASEVRASLHQAEEGRHSAQLQAARLLLDQAQLQGSLGEPDRAVHDLLTALRLTRGRELALARSARYNLTGWMDYVPAMEGTTSITEEVTCLARGSTGMLLTGALDGRVRRRDREGRFVGSDWQQRGSIRALRLDRFGGRVLVVTAGQAQVRDLDSGIVQATINRETAAFTDAVFAAEEGEIFTGDEDGRVQRWKGGQRLEEPYVHPLAVRRLALTPDGRTLAVALAGAGGRDGAVWIWNLKDRSRVPRILPHPRGVAALASHPDGERLATGGEDGRVRVWRWSDGVIEGEEFTHSTAIRHVQWTPDGRTMLTVTSDDAARLWDVGMRRVQAIFRGARPATQLTDEGARVLLSLPGEVRLRALARPPSRLAASAARPSNWFSRPGPFAITPEGARVLVAGPTGKWVWSRSPDTEEELPHGWRQWFREVSRIVIDPKRECAAIVSQSGALSAVQLWSMREDRAVHPPWLVPRPVTTLAFSQEGTAVIAGDDRGMVRWWDTRSGRMQEPSWLGPGRVEALTHSPEGNWLAIAVRISEEQSEVRFLDAERKDGPKFPHPSRVERLVFSPDGRRLLIQGDISRVWHLESRKPSPIVYRGTTTGLFSADGQMLLIAGRDGEVELCRSDEERTTTVLHPGAVTSLDLSRDGKRLLVGGVDGTVRLWSVEGSPRPLGPAVVANRPILAARFHREEQAFFTLTADAEVRNWRIPAAGNETLEEYERAVQARTGREIDPSGRLIPLTPTAWTLVRGQERSAAESESEVTRWHARQARDARQDGDLWGEKYHLDRLVQFCPTKREWYRRRAVLLARMRHDKEALTDLHKAAGATGRLANEARYAEWVCEQLGDADAARWFAGLQGD